jgi:predicted nucleotidyltransferase component of viral defense system
VSLDNYKKQVELLLNVLPFIEQEKCFALKGGTAINLFVRNMPRLSVDIDLTYMGEESRKQALTLIAVALLRIKSKVESKIPGSKVKSSKRISQNDEAKIYIERNGVTVKVEANPVIRGSLYSTNARTLQTAAVEEFEVELEMTVANLGDLYGGKLAAALDRQHPRDLFDVFLLMQNEGLTDKIKNGLICYLLSHKRPIHEVINPTLRDQGELFEREFTGMTSVPFTYANFEETRSHMIDLIHSKLTDEDKKFLISFSRGEPIWSLFAEKKLASLPAVLWKLENIKKMDPEKRKLMTSFLIQAFQRTR